MWKEEDHKLKKTFQFKNFSEAYQFIIEAGDLMNSMNHHAYWCNQYDKVNFELSTHEAGDIVTDKDRKLAEALDSIFENL